MKRAQRTSNPLQRSINKKSMTTGFGIYPCRFTLCTPEKNSFASSSVEHDVRKIPNVKNFRANIDRIIEVGCCGSALIAQTSSHDQYINPFQLNGYLHTSLLFTEPKVVR